MIARLQRALDRALTERDAERATNKRLLEKLGPIPAEVVLPARPTAERPGIDAETERALKQAQLEYERRVEVHDRSCTRSTHARCVSSIKSLPGFREKCLRDWRSGHASEKAVLLAHADAEEKKLLAPWPAKAAPKPIDSWASVKPEDYDPKNFTPVAPR